MGDRENLVDPGENEVGAGEDDGDAEGNETSPEANPGHEEGEETGANGYGVSAGGHQGQEEESAVCSGPKDVASGG